MGCGSSKVDDLQAVVLCRNRCSCLDEAIKFRFAFAEAHVAYIKSLKGVGVSLHKFFDQDLRGGGVSVAPPSPVLPLPTQRKGDPAPGGGTPPPAAAAVAHHKHSNSGSHLNFHTESEDDDDDDDGSFGSHHHHSDHSSPLHLHNYPIDYTQHQQQETLGSFPGGGFMNINYMKNKTTQSVVYEQRPASPEIVHMSTGGGESSYNPYYNNTQNPSSYPYYGYQSYGNVGGFFGGSYPPQQQYGYSSPPPPAYAAASTSEASSSKPPPPPPSPPRTSPWDFILYPFDNYEKHYPPYTPSRDSREVREEEGIPDLEVEDYQNEVVKEVHGNQKFVDAGNYSKQVVDEHEKLNSLNTREVYHGKPPVEENDAVEYEVHMMEKKNVAANQQNNDRSNVGAFKGRGGLRGLSEVVREIQVQFERASDSGNELAKILEVGKLPYQRKNSAYQVSSKMLHVITPSMSVVSSQPSTSTSADSASSTDKASSSFMDFDEDAGTRLKNLSSTLRELYLWEKKLYEEVKVEEKMRIDHERKTRRLKRLDERGAEALKVDTTRTLIRTLSTKIKIAIQSIDKISVKINQLRDKELSHHINELIQGLATMWKAMLDCHHSQCIAIEEAKSLDAIAAQSHKMLSDSHLEATIQLERELLNWTLSFSRWITTQKGYVRALNNWLINCIIYEPEETPDGPVPYSPGRIGAPPVFVVCNQWSQAMDRISEKEVVDSLRVFAASVLQLWERDKAKLRQGMVANKEMERVVKNLEREDMKVQKEIQNLEKKMVLASGDSALSGQAVYQSDTSSNCSLQENMKRIFEAMERFTANSMQAYEELLARNEEDRLARESVNS